MPFATMALFAFLFETPWGALGAAGAAGAIPVIIHLLSRRRYRVVTWAAMRFLLAAQRKSTRRMRLEQWLLLAVRVLVAVLLAAAMAGVMPWAEPLWARLFGGASVVTTAGARRTHKVLVLDGSLSMAARVGDTTCFERARGLALRVLAESHAGDGFSVLLMASPPRRVVPEAADDAAKVADEVRALYLPHGNADVAATLHAVEDILRRSPDKYQEREVYFLTDLQRSTWAGRRPADVAGPLQALGARARSVLVDVGQDGLNNLAVTDLAVGVPLATSGTVTPIVATVHNFGADARKQLRADLWIGRARASAGDPPFELRAAGQQVVDVPAGQSATVTFPHTFVLAGDYAVQVRLEGDALEPDDLRTAVVPVRETLPVMLVNGKPAPQVYDRATEWLKDALNPYPPGQAPRHVAARPTVLSESQFADVGTGDLTPFDCVFLCDLARLDGGQVRRLEAHLRRGGGVVFCLGPQADLEAYDRLLYRNGEGLLPARLVGYRRAPAGQSFGLFAAEEAYRRPPLDAFAADADRLSLTGARFRQYVRAELPPRGPAQVLLSFVPLAAPGTAAAAPAEPKPTPTAGPSLAGEPAVVAWPRYRGRVVLLTTTANMDWTSWPVSPSYPAFMQELLRYASAGRLRGQAAVVGDALEESLPIGEAGLDVAVYTPRIGAGPPETTRTEDREDGALLRWTDTDVSGLYRATLGRSPQDYLFAVNVPAATEAQEASESDLARAGADELRAAYPGWDFQLVRDLAEVQHAGGAAVPADEAPAGVLGAAVARYLLLAMLALALAEVVLAWRFGHHGDAGVGDVPPASGRVLPTVLGASAGLILAAGLAVLAHAAWTGEFLGFLPAAARGRIEAALGVPPPVPGEGTHWRLEADPFPGDAQNPWTAVAVALAAAALVVGVYLREGKTSRPGYRMLLAAFRLGLVLLLLLVLLPELRLLFERQSWPDVALLIDDSASMATADRYQDERVGAAAARLARDQGLSEPGRLQLAQALVAGRSPDWLERLLDRQQVKVHVYHCSTRAARLADVTGAADAEGRRSAAAAIRGLRPEGDSSQLGTAVRQVLNDFRGSSLAAVIMLTDGVTTEGEDLAQAARFAARKGVPLFFVGVGDAREVRDLKLHDLQVEDSVYVNDRLVFEVRLTGQGYTDLTVPVTLREKGKEAVLATQTVKVDPAGRPVRVRLAHRPTEPGEKTYVLEVPEQPDEIHPADNNKIERPVVVRENKLIKVFYVEGYARYEYRFVKALLERESAQDPRNKSIDLKVLLLDADPDYPKYDRSAVGEFPAKGELNQFDVVIVGDVDPANERVARHWADVADFVRERGGGLLLMAGERASPWAFRDTALAPVLPIEITGGEPAEADRTEGYRPALTGAARAHPMFRFSPDEAENAAIWDRLPELFWWAEGYQAKPGAEALVVHPGRPAERGPAGEGGGRHPLLLQHFVGAGRCLFFGIDETWRWRFREDELRYNQFWIQAVRYLARSRLGRVTLTLDRQTPYRRGEPIRITVRFPEEAPLPDPQAEVRVVAQRRLERPGAPPEHEEQTLTLARVQGSRGTYEAVLTRTPEGEYRFWLSAPAVPGTRPRAECRVLPPPGELDRLRMSQGEMERAAADTQGRFYTLADADSLPDDLPPGTRIALSAPQPPWLLWNRPAVFGLALFLLGSEWFLRKRKYLL